MIKSIEQTKKEFIQRDLELVMSSPELDIRLVSALAGDRNLNAREINIVERLYKTRQEHFYCDILYALTYKSFSPIQSKAIWENILEHRKNLKSALKRDVGLSVATHDYLENINKSLSYCTIIEEQKLNHLTKVATKDGLTGLFDQASFKRKLNEYLEEKLQTESDLSLIMFDLDNFKKVNDNFGHPEGDRVLKEVATILQLCARREDLVARYGGEEFAIIIPQTNYENAQQVGERIRQRVEDFFKERKYSVTLSMGLYHLLPKSYLGSLELIEKADQLMYVSKTTGKNRLTCEKL
jgi:diguanylate cyclase (GGDEF)-like protein